MTDLPQFHAWMTDAACTEYDPELWWPTPGGDNRRVIEICNGCQVKKQCLQFATDNGEKAGIWGGVGMRNYRDEDDEEVA